MRDITKAHWNEHGNIKKSAYKDLDGHDQIYAWLRNFDKSNAYKPCLTLGAPRARLITNYLTKVLGVDVKGIKMPEQTAIVYQDFNLFKTYVNHIWKEGILNRMS